MPQRIAFRMNLNPGEAAEYEKRHNEVFPELAQALTDAGVSDYTIWLDAETGHLFATLVLSENNTLDALPETEICKRWWTFMADIMETDASNVPFQAPLKRVFYLP